MAYFKQLGSDLTILKNKVVTITPQTVSFPGNVLQTQNISCFAERKIYGDAISWFWIVCCFLSGALIVAFSSETYFQLQIINIIGGLILFAGACGVFWNFSRPQYSGLLISLNSGDKKLFVTSDREGLSKALSELSRFLNNESEVTYELSIHDDNVLGHYIQSD